MLFERLLKHNLNKQSKLAHIESLNRLVYDMRKDEVSLFAWTRKESGEYMKYFNP